MLLRFACFLVSKITTLSLHGYIADKVASKHVAFCRLVWIVDKGFAVIKKEKKKVGRLKLNVLDKKQRL